MSSRAPVVLSRKRYSIPSCGSLIARVTFPLGLFLAILACDRSLFPFQIGLLGKSLQKLVPGIPGARKLAENDRTAIERSLVEQTHGLMVVDMVAISELCRNEKVAADRIDDGVRRFKLGVTENPWAKLDRQSIANADQFVAKRIKGQRHAVIKMLDIVKRSVIGISGSEGRSGRPRGVAFLAGPRAQEKPSLLRP